MAKARLTDWYIRKQRLPESGRLDIWDTLVTGLGLRMTSGGVRSWSVRYRAGKIHRRFTLGTYPAMSLKEAREEALEAIRKVKKGRDLQREKETARSAMLPQ